MTELSELRRALGFSVTEAAEFLQVPPDAVAAYETDIRPAPAQALQAFKGLLAASSKKNTAKLSESEMMQRSSKMLPEAHLKNLPAALQKQRKHICGLEAKVNAKGLAPAPHCTLPLLSIATDRRSKDAARAELFARYAARIAANPSLTRQLVSYQGSKRRPFVRWMKYKEAFSAEFVRFVFDSFRLPARPALFDPFAGSGTALFCAAERGWDATGTELLPVGIAVANARLAAQSVDPRVLRRAVASVESAISEHRKGIAFQHLAITQGAFTPTTEDEIGRFRMYAESQSDPRVRTLLHFAALCVLEDVSFTRKDGQYLRWDRRSGRGLSNVFHKGEIQPFRSAVMSKLGQIVADIAENDRLKSSVTIKQTSFLQYGLKMAPEAIDLVVTSPPYCNRYDYTRTYALELAYLGYDEDSVRRMRQALLTATVENRPKVEVLRTDFTKAGQASRHSGIQRVIDRADALHEVLEILEGAAARGELNNPNIPRMVRNYFFEMAVCISHLGRGVRPGGLVVMVNDNVRYFGEELPVDLLLSSFAEQLGFTLQRIWYLPRGKGNSSQQMGAHGRSELRKSVYVWRRT